MAMKTRHVHARSGEWIAVHRGGGGGCSGSGGGDEPAWLIFGAVALVSGALWCLYRLVQMFLVWLIPAWPHFAWGAVAGITLLSVVLVIFRLGRDEDMVR